MSGQSNSIVFSLFKKFGDVTGFSARITQDAVEALYHSSSDSEMIEEILERSYKTPGQIYDAVSRLRDIGTDEAAEGILKLFGEYSEVEGLNPYTQPGLVEHAISSLKTIKDTELYIAHIVYHEHQDLFDENGGQFSGAITHEQLGIDAIVGMGGQDVIHALLVIGNKYREAVAGALADYVPAQNDVMPVND